MRWLVALAAALALAGCTVPPRELEEAKEALAAAERERQSAVSILSEVQAKLERAREDLEKANASLALGRVVEREREISLHLRGTEGNSTNRLDWRAEPTDLGENERLVRTSLGRINVFIVDAATFDPESDFNATAQILSRVVVDPAIAGFAEVPKTAYAYVRAGVPPFEERDVVWAAAESRYYVRNATATTWDTVPYDSGDVLTLPFAGLVAVTVVPATE